MELTAEQKEWIEALREKGRKQIKGKLHDGKNGFCCLGVACDIFAERLGLKLVYQADCHGWKDDGPVISTGTLPGKVVDLLRLNSERGNVFKNTINFTWASLSDANDRGCSFDSIADALETTPELFFKKRLGS